MAVTKKFLKTKPEVQVTFEIKADAAADASQVYIVGEFANWEPVELKKLKSGLFKKISLKSIVKISLACPCKTLKVCKKMMTMNMRKVMKPTN